MPSERDGKTMTATRSDVKPWERRQDESAQAYAAFTVYRDLGAARTLIAAAQQLGKNYSLIRRWADRHHWQERVYAWDRTQARADEAAIRQQRDEMVRRQMQDADRLQRLAMAKITTLVSRNPQTGELTLDPAVTPQQAVSHLSPEPAHSASDARGSTRESESLRRRGSRPRRNSAASLALNSQN